MRSYLLASCLIAAPGLALAAPQCALPPSPNNQPAESLDRPAVPLPETIRVGTPTAPAEAAPPIPVPRPAVTPAAGAVPAALQQIPSLQRMAAGGATLTDQGEVHGVRRVVVRTGDQFMLLSATLDGQAVVGGLMSDLSATELARIAGGNLTELGLQHGLRGMLVKSGPQFQVFYATPDGERVIPGVMWDASGKNLTREC